MSQTPKGSYLGKLPLWPTDPLYHCRDSRYSPNHKKSGCHSLGPEFKCWRKHDVCKCLVTLRHCGTLISPRAASLLVWLVGGEEKCEASDHLRMFSLKIGVEPSQLVLAGA
ncbi:hypothetical protein TNCV_2730491 [Trichonephila clavipes]|nr:hypothetical protein TNCV_2730491 [Trichonephila clavipes]